MQGFRNIPLVVSEKIKDGCGGHICLPTILILRRTHLGIKRKSYVRFRQNCYSGFNDENQRWLPAAIFVDEPEVLSSGHN